VRLTESGFEALIVDKFLPVSEVKAIGKLSQGSDFNCRTISPSLTR
jgi:hypothetical protein